MHTTRKRATWRTMVGALGLCAATAGGLRADTMDSTATGTDMNVLAVVSAGVEAEAGTVRIQTAANTPIVTPVINSVMQYGTSGSIGTTGITGPNVISFVPEQSGTVTTPSSFSLGTFVVGFLPPGQTTSYVNTPFSITYTTQQVNGVEPDPNQSPVTISGVLNGSVFGPSQSDVTATFKKMTKPSFITGDYLNTLSVLDPKIALVPSTTNFGRTTAQGSLQVSPAPVPEPTTIALFVAAIAGVGLRRRFARRAD